MPRFNWYLAPIAAIVTVMSKWRMEAVDNLEDKRLKMPTADMVGKILKDLWMICSGEKSGDGFDLPPEGEFGIARQRTSKDRIFRVRDFEGRRTVKGERTEEGRGPGRGGLDLLGTYSLENSLITIYLDSCRRVEQEYGDGSWTLEKLIDVVLIHELTHLITHINFYLTGGETEHVWEYTAQCATYAYLKIHKEPENLKVFEDLSPHQPFIYRTWEGLKAVESVQSEWCRCVQSTQQTVEVVKSVFRALIEPKPAPGPDDMVTCYDRSKEE
jgi:hypothetical protein